MPVSIVAPRAARGCRRARRCRTATRRRGRRLAAQRRGARPWRQESARPVGAGGSAGAAAPGSSFSERHRAPARGAARRRSRAMIVTRLASHAPNSHRSQQVWRSRSERAGRLHSVSAGRLRAGGDAAPGRDHADPARPENPGNDGGLPGGRRVDRDPAAAGRGDHRVSPGTASRPAGRDPAGGRHAVVPAARRGLGVSELRGWKTFVARLLRSGLIAIDPAVEGILACTAGGGRIPGARRSGIS